MKVRNLVCCFVMVGALGLVAGKALSQDGEGGDMPPGMADFLKYSSPNENHKHLHRIVGSWDTAGKFWMEPGKPPTETKGTSTMSTILGGRFIKHEHSSTVMGRPFEGFGLDGYDNLKKMYVSTWTDTMSTAFYTMEGDRDPETGTTTMLGNWNSPTGGVMKVKSVNTWKDDDTAVYEMFDWVDGKWKRSMQLTYTRRK